MLVKSLPLPELSSPDGLSMAFSRGTSPELLERFRRGLQTIKSNGTYDAIMRRWLGKPQ